MSSRFVLSEARANLETGASRTRMVSITLGLLISAFTFLDLNSVSNLIDKATEFRESGGSVAVLAVEGGVSGQECVALSAISGLDNAGALRQTGDQLVAPQLPGLPIPIVETTLSMASILVRTPGFSAQPGLYLSAEVADSLGVSSGETIPGTDAFVVEVFPYPDDGRVETLRFVAVSTVDDDGLFDECWVETASSYEEDREIARLARAINLPPSTDVVFRQLNSVLGKEFRTVVAFNERTSAAAPLFVLMASIALGTFWTYLRRLEFASNLQAGVTPNSQALQIFLEILVMWTFGAIIAAIAISLHPLTLSETSYVVSELVAVSLLALSGFLGGSLAYHATISEKKIYRYFKSR